MPMPPWSDQPPPPRPGPAAPVSPAAPLAGLTVLLVEDSRLASDALRLVMQRCGGRLRRAETLAMARRHLHVYRPDVVIVDLGLPDGRGEDLIADIARTGGPPVLGMSGDDLGLVRARRAGAAGFLPKPARSLAEVCAAILALLPDRAWLTRRLPGATLSGATLSGADLPVHDPLALRDDLRHAAAVLGRADGLRYAAGLVEGVAGAVGDDGLARAARDARAQPQAIGDLARSLALRLAKPATMAPAPMAPIG